MSAADNPESRPAWLDMVRDQVGTMRFGVVQIGVHDGKVVQFEEPDRKGPTAGEDDQSGPSLSLRVYGRLKFSRRFISSATAVPARSCPAIAR